MKYIINKNQILYINFFEYNIEKEIEFKLKDGKRISLSCKENMPINIDKTLHNILNTSKQFIIINDCVKVKEGEYTWTIE